MSASLQVLKQVLNHGSNVSKMLSVRWQIYPFKRSSTAPFTIVFASPYFQGIVDILFLRELYVSLQGTKQSGF